MIDVTERTSVYPAHPFRDELGVACAAAVRAGAAVMQFYGDSRFELKAGASPVTAADHASNDVILKALHAAYPTDAILSEETRDSPARQQASRVWIVDPLDGTKEFLSGIAEFSVMIALLVDGRLRVGVVYQPVDDVLYFAASGGGTFRNSASGTTQLKCSPAADPVRVVGSRSHTDPLVAELCRRNGFDEPRPCGSVGVKCARIAEGVFDLYVHPVPYMSEWDTAAPELILREAGGAVTDCSGAPLVYNKPDPKQPLGILAAHPGLAARVLPALGELQADASRA